MEVCAPVPVDQASIFSFKQGESTPRCHESFSGAYEGLPAENTKFTIRGFVASVRRKDIRKTWPFSEPLLEQYIVEGKSLPNLDSPSPNEDSGLRSQETALTTDGATPGSDDGDFRKTPEQEQCHQQQQQSGDHHPEGENVPGHTGCERVQNFNNGSSNRRTSSIAPAGPLLVVESDSEGRGELRNGDSLEDKGSDTGVVDPDPDPEPEEPKAESRADHQDETGAAGAAAAAGTDVADHDHQQQKSLETQRVCPVCGTFSCHSVTALNAHMDGCLTSAAPGGEKAPQRARSSKGFKVQKMRSITDIIAADPSPRAESKLLNPEDSGMVREKRAPSANHILVLGDHHEIHNPQQQHHQQQQESQQQLRQLRSRSRGSRSMATRLDAAVPERSTRSRMRKTSGEWSHQEVQAAATRAIRNRHCSGNSVEVTSSWTPSISSGTYCHSKAKDVQVQEKSCAAEEKPSESHGSAGPSTNLRPIQEEESSPISSKEPETAENAAASSNKPQAQEDKPEELSQAQIDDAAADQTSKIEAIPEEVRPGVHDLEKQEAGDKSSDQPAEPMEIVAEDTNQVMITEPHPAPPAASSSQPETPRQPVATPPPSVPLPPPAVHHQQPLRQPIPVYESMISSLRSGTPVDNLTGQNNFTPTWKAAVVMATLGATPRRSSSTNRAPPTPGSGARPGEVPAPRFAPAPTNTNTVPVVDLGAKANTVQHAFGARGLGEANSSKDPGLLGYQPVFYSGVHTGQGSSAYQNHFNTLAESLQQHQVYAGQRGSQLPKFPGWMNAGGENRAVIHLEAPEGARGGGDGKPGEKPAFKLLGQTVKVQESTPTPQVPKEIPPQGGSCGTSKGFPYGYSASGCHQSAARTGCCCGSSHSLGKDPVPGAYGSGGIGSFPHIPPLGTWRYAPVTGQPLSVPVSGAKFHAAPQHQHHQGNSKHQASSASEQLPPWLLEAKKQKEAEVAASTVIVIEDDEPEEHKAIRPEVPRNRSDRQQSNAGNKREAGDHWNLSGDKAIKLSASDSPAATTTATATATTSRVVYVPMMFTDHHHAAAATASINNNSNSSSNPMVNQLHSPSSAGTGGAKRGATAQTYKARIAMWKALMQGAEQQQPLISQSRVTPGAPPGSYVYHHASQLQGAASSSSRVFPGFSECSAAPAAPASHQNHLVQGHHHQQLNLNQLVLGRDCQVISLDGTPCLLLDPHMIDPASAGASSNHNHQLQGDHQHGAGGGGGFARSFVMSAGDNQSGPGAGAGAGSGQQIVMAPVTLAQHPGFSGLNFVLAPAAGGTHQQLVQMVPVASVVQQSQQQQQQQQQIQQHLLQNHHQVRGPVAWQLQQNKNGH